jgi:hypothetical protein
VNANMKILNEDKEGICKVVDGIITKYQLQSFYTLIDLEEYLEQIGVEYANDSSWLYLYSIDYIKSKTGDVFILNGNENEKTQIFEKYE